MKKYAGFAEMNMVLTTIPKAHLLPFVISCEYVYNSYLLKNCTLIKAFFFPYEQILPAMCFFPLTFLTTETTYNLCLLQFISALFKF